MLYFIFFIFFIVLFVHNLTVFLCFSLVYIEMKLSKKTNKKTPIFYMYRKINCSICCCCCCCCCIVSVLQMNEFGQTTEEKFYIILTNQRDVRVFII